MDIAEYFRLTVDNARAVLREVSAATGRWRTAARKVGLDRAAVERMAPAFEHEQAEAAREVFGSLAKSR